MPVQPASSQDRASRSAHAVLMISSVHAAGLGSTRRWQGPAGETKPALASLRAFPRACWTSFLIPQPMRVC